MQFRIGVVALMLAPLLWGCGRVGYDSRAFTATGPDGGGIDAETDCGGIDAGTDDGSSAYCGNRLIEGDEVCDDGNRADGDGCSADCLRNELCGDGVLATGEACDDGNSVNGDGCDNDCTPSCTMDAQCNDGEPCNGEEVCSPESACSSGTPLSEATICGDDGACHGGSCAPAGCGDEVVEGEEQCDDGNTVSGDGCENDCTFSCVEAAECDDGDACTGTETCDEDVHLCVAGAAEDDGTECDRDGSASTLDVCLGGTCHASRCGDGFVDTGRGEDCDDANGVNGDGCDNDCTFSCETDGECDDGLVCNGAEQCTAEHRCGAGTPAADGTSCTGGTCAGGVCSLSTLDGGVGGTRCGEVICSLVCCCATTSTCLPRGGSCLDVECKPSS